MVLRALVLQQWNNDGKRYVHPTIPVLLSLHVLSTMFNHHVYILSCALDTLQYVIERLFLFLSTSAFEFSISVKQRGYNKFNISRICQRLHFSVLYILFRVPLMFKCHVDYASFFIFELSIILLGHLYHIKHCSNRNIGFSAFFSCIFFTLSSFMTSPKFLEFDVE